MRTTTLALAAILAGCSVEPAAEHAQVRQPLPTLPPFPPHVGRTQGARLGTSVAACRVPGFVAGAPGENTTYLFRDGGLWLPPPPPTAVGFGGAGVAVGCEGGPGNARVLTAGLLGAWELRPTDGGGWFLIEAAQVETLQVGPSSTTPLLVGMPATGTVGLHMVTAGGYSAVRDLPGVPTAGSALAWDPAGTFFVVGDPMAGSIRLFGWVPDGGLGGASPAGLTVYGPALSGFGSALAIGDVHPNPGRELIVGAPWSAQVFIYGAPAMAQPPRELMVLAATGPGALGSFGTSLAIEPTPVSGGTLRALWVGDPINAQVVRFVGDAGQPLISTEPASYFGFSLAVSEQNLVVGAPFYSDAESNQGAVYSLPFGTVVISNSEPRTCSVGCITSNCMFGRCVGGVVCQPMGNPLCDPGDCNNGVCQPDAGELDAGELDAGELDAGELDAGEPDAGEPDAGEPDAGEPDAGEPDAGEPDAGEPDAGEPDAGEPDAGEADAGQADAGSKPGKADGGPDTTPLKFGTCGCSGAGAIPLVLLSLFWSRRRSTTPKPRKSTNGAAQI